MEVEILMINLLKERPKLLRLSSNVYNGAHRENLKRFVAINRPPPPKKNSVIVV